MSDHCKKHGIEACNACRIDALDLRMANLEKQNPPKPEYPSAALYHCPFCGMPSRFGQESCGRYYIKCANSKCGVITSQLYATREELATIWNRRDGYGFK